jgi:hypothetical protein
MHDFFDGEKPLSRYEQTISKVARKGSLENYSASKRKKDAINRRQSYLQRQSSQENAVKMPYPVTE